MTKRRLLLLIGAPVVLVGLIVLLGVRVTHEAPGARPPPASAAAHAPLFFPPIPGELPSDEAAGKEGSKAQQAPTPPASPLYRDSTDYAREIAGKAEFKAFASNANLTSEEQAQVSHIVALYFMDDESLKNSTKDAEKLASMRKQLLIHMHVRVRAKIPSKWEAFEQANLLPSVVDFEKSPT